MAVYRTVHLSFWDDTKVVDDFTPEDKYFYLYLLTNPHTNICGCYEISTKQMARETGYNEDSVKHLINRMETVHRVVRYDRENKEMFVFNWYRYNWTKSSDALKGLVSNADKIKSENTKAIVLGMIDAFAKDEDVKRVYRGSIEGMETSVPVTVYNTDSVYDTVSNINNTDSNKDIRKEIIDYMNSVLGTRYKYTSKQTNSLINARLAEGNTVDDFKKVIDNMYSAWGDDEKMSAYLRPQTLFSGNFEGYLNKRIVPKQTGNMSVANAWANA